MTYQTSVLRITILKPENTDLASAEIVKVTLPQTQISNDMEMWNAEKQLQADASNARTLLNLLYVPENSFLSKVVDYFVRLESITSLHIIFFFFLLLVSNYLLLYIRYFAHFSMDKIWSFFKRI